MVKYNPKKYPTFKQRLHDKIKEITSKTYPELNVEYLKELENLDEELKANKITFKEWFIKLQQIKDKYGESKE